MTTSARDRAESLLQMYAPGMLPGKAIDAMIAFAQEQRAEERARIIAAIPGGSICDPQTICDLIRELPVDGGADGWLPIETAPKDGTRILAWCVHETAKYSKDPIKEGWAGAVIASWTEFNKGGWVWNGHAGTFTGWQPLPPPPVSEAGK